MTNRVLIVDGYGVALAVERGHLLIRDGFATENSKREIRFPRGRCDIDRIVIRASAGNVTLDAIDWCQRMGIALAIVGSDSRMINCLIPDGSHDGPLRRAQAISGTNDEALRLATWILKRKFESQLKAVDERLSETSRQQLQTCIDGLSADQTLYDLLAREGRVSKIYWDALTGNALPWPEWTHKRIPTHWRMISTRASGGRDRVRDATDPFNALLNYGYTLLEVETRIACSVESLDPDMGYLHVDERRRESFIYDLLEPIRVLVDKVTLEWLERGGAHPHNFIELSDGVVRIDPDAARLYAEHLMPRLRQPALSIAADFANQLRKVDIPYRLITERTAARKAGTKVGVGTPCGYCSQPVLKIGRKFCGRTCYLRHSVEVRQPIKAAHAKLRALRKQGLSPGHGGEAAKKRGAKIAESNKRRRMDLTKSEYNERRAAQAREYRRKRKCSLDNASVVQNKT